jgi:outer membrane immunogenic protein
MKTRFLLGVAAAGCVLAASAFAADLPLKAPTAPVAVPICDWCGVYIGLNAGWVGGHKDVDFTGTSPLGPSIVPDLATLDQLGSPRLSNNGFIGGGQIGVNSQWDNWVVGLEGDIQYMGLKFSRTTGELTPFGTALGTPTVAFHEEETDHWLATARIRGGVAFGPALIYATGGLAFGQQDFSQSFVINNPGGFVIAGAPEFGCCVSALGSTNRFAAGWTAGGGVEFRFAPNWSVKAEGLYVDLGKEGFDETLVTPAALTAKNCAPNCFSGFTAHVDAHLTAAIARVGINYRFWSPEPIAARY